MRVRTRKESKLIPSITTPPGDQGRPRLVFEEQGPELGQVNVANRGLESRLDPQIDLFIFNSRPARSQTQSFCKVIIGDYGATTMRLSRSLFGVPSEYQQLSQPAISPTDVSAHRPCFDRALKRYN